MMTTETTKKRVRKRGWRSVLVLAVLLGVGWPFVGSTRADDSIRTTGTVFWSHSSGANAFDGNTTTYPDTPTISGYCGLDLGEGRARQLGYVRYYPRAAFPSRMKGGKFQGSNEGPAGGYTDICVITATPAVAWTTLTNSADNGFYRYIRYLSPDYGYLNVAELAFYERVIGHQPATEIMTTSARLNGILGSTGLEPDSPPAHVRVHYGPVDQGTNWTQWAAHHDFGFSNAPAFLSYPASGLAPDTCYAYRFHATNALVDAAAEPASVFMTASVRLTNTCDASEIGLTKGTFTVYRAASATNLPVTVYYERTGGTAVTGKHIAALPGFSVTIPEGATQAAIVVTPLLDIYTDTDTTLELTLLPGGYRLEGQASAAMAIHTAPTPVDVPATGTVFGTAVNYAYAFDGNTATTPDGPADGGTCGLDLGAERAQRITRIRFFPRAGLPQRMTGGKFQGSNTSATNGFADLYTVPSTPPAGWTTITNEDATPYRFVRYRSPNGGYCNVGEIEFCVRFFLHRRPGAVVMIR